MAQGCLSVLLLSLGKGLVWLGYGSKGMKAREAAGKNDKPIIGLFFLLVLWEFVALVILFGIGRTSEDMVYGILSVAVPLVLYICWVIYARKSVKPLVAQYEEKIKQQETEAQEKELEDLRANRWVCRSCGRKNEGTDIFCKDCGEYR